MCGGCLSLCASPSVRLWVCVCTFLCVCVTVQLCLRLGPSVSPKLAPARRGSWVCRTETSGGSLGGFAVLFKDPIIDLKSVFVRAEGEVYITSTFECVGGSRRGWGPRILTTDTRGPFPTRTLDFPGVTRPSSPDETPLGSSTLPSPSLPRGTTSHPCGGFRPRLVRDPSSLPRPLTSLWDSTLRRGPSFRTK